MGRHQKRGSEGPADGGNRRSSWRCLVVGFGEKEPSWRGRVGLRLSLTDIPTMTITMTIYDNDLFVLFYLLLFIYLIRSIITNNYPHWRPLLILFPLALFDLRKKGVITKGKGRSIMALLELRRYGIRGTLQVVALLFHTHKKKDRQSPSRNHH